MSFEFTFSDDECDDFDIKRDTAPTQSSSKLHAKEDELIVDSGEFDPIRTEMFQCTAKIADVTEYTDVIHGLYEGGLKLWECSDDLLNFLRSKTKNEDFVGQRVIDLGCGHGHPGIWCLTRGASIACFQDLNVEVLSTTTAPNLLKICGAGPIIKKKQLTEDETEKSSTTPTTKDEEADTAAHKNVDELARLELLVKNNISTGASSSVKTTKKTKRANTSHDLLEYERIKALVLSGEEKDPEMLEWLLEIEEEMAMEEVDSENDEEHGKDDARLEVAFPTQAKIKVIQNQGYSLPQQNASLQPHATLIYGPWGDAALERAMLLSSVHTTQPCTDFVQKEVQYVNPFASKYPTFTYSDSSLREEGAKEQSSRVTSSSQDYVFSSLFSSVAAHFASAGTQNDALQCTLSLNEADEFTLTKSDDNTLDVNTLLSALSLGAPSETNSVDHTPPNTTFGLVITPVMIKVEIFNSASQRTLDTLLSFMIAFADITNAVYTQYYEQITTTATTDTPSDLLKASLPEPDQPLSAAEQKKRSKYRKPDDAYVKPTYSAATKYSITTILSITTSTKYYNTLRKSGFIETNWSEPSETDRLQGQSTNTTTVVSTAALEKDVETNPDSAIAKTVTTALTIPQFSSVTTTFARPFISCQQHFLQPNPPESFTSLIQTLLPKLTVAASLPTALGFCSTQRQLFYGSHPIHSPFRYQTILSSDTIYSCPTMPIFIQSIRSLLHYNGKALIAAKRYYFGVGGSTAEFSRLITEHCPDLKIRQVDLIMDGASNIREILEVTWNHDIVSGIW